MSPPSYSGPSGGPGYDFSCSSPQLMVVIAMVRNRSCDVTAAATVQHCRRSSSQAPAPVQASSGIRGRTAATVQRRRNMSTAVATTATVPTRVCSSSTDAAPMVARGTVRHLRSTSQAPASCLALSGTRSTTAATVQRRHSSHGPASSLALTGSRDTLATIDRR